MESVHQFEKSIPSQYKKVHEKNIKEKIFSLDFLKKIFYIPHAYENVF
jgi:hypothetical protein